MASSVLAAAGSQPQQTFLPPNTGDYEIFFSVGSVTRRVFFNGTTMGHVEHACMAAYGIKNIPLAKDRSVFRIRTAVGKNNNPLTIPFLALSQLSPGCVLDVDDPVLRAACRLNAWREPIPKREQAPSIAALMAARRFGARVRKQVEKKRTKLEILRRSMDKLLNEPGSSKGAMTLACFILFLIVVSTVNFCVDTLPNVYKADLGNDAMSQMFGQPTATVETICIACFTIEFCLRLGIAKKRIQFMRDTLNLIDLVAIVPFYVELIIAGVEVPGLSVLRVMRLARVFRLFKVSKGSITVLTRTMSKSAKPLYMLVFLTMIATVLFASILYYVERGTYDEQTGVWIRVVGHRCEVKCQKAGYPAGCVPGADKVEVQWADHCPKGCLNECTDIFEQSPFESIPQSAWWSLVTMTTLGYGDMFPVSVLGKFLGMVTVMTGILVIALPITVVGSNFNSVYSREGEALDITRELPGAETLVWQGSSDSSDGEEKMQKRLRKRTVRRRRGAL